MSVDAELRAPVATWRLAKPSERLAVNPADSLPFRLLAWGFLILAAVLMVSLRKTEATFFGDVKLFIILVLSQIVLIYLLTKSSNDVFLGTGLKRLKAKVPVEEACSVAVQIYQEGSVTGADEGFLWLGENTLHFKGLQSVWRLNADDVKPLDEWPPGMKRKLAEHVVLAGTGPVKHLHISQIDPFEDFATRRKVSRFNNALGRWYVERPSGSIESMLPPLELHPGLDRSGPLRNEGLISGLVLLAINIFLLLNTRPDFAFKTIVAVDSLLQFGVVLVLVYCSVRFAWQQVVDRRVRRGLTTDALKK